MQIWQIPFYFKSNGVLNSYWLNLETSIFRIESTDGSNLQNKMINVQYNDGVKAVDVKELCDDVIRRIAT